MPSRHLETSGWVRPPRFPLGGLFGGACHAHPDEVVEPPETQQRELCNCGYARGRCDRFPGDGSADAVRFSVTDETEGRVAVLYVLEKDHAPVEHGTLEYSIDDASLMQSRLGDILAQQARTFIESYLGRRARGASV